MNLTARYHTWSHALVFLGILTYGIAEENLVHPLIAAPLIIAAQLLVVGPKGRTLPRWAINLALLASTFGMTINWADSLGETVSVLCSYLVWLQLIKLFEPRTTRDQGQQLLLSVMLVLGSCLTSVTAELGAVLLLYLPALVLTSMLFQVYAAEEHATVKSRPQSAAPSASAPSSRFDKALAWIFGIGPAQETRLASPRIPHAPSRRAWGDLIRVSALATIVMALLAPAVYIAMPRGLGEGIFGRWQPATSTNYVSGFRDHVQLGAQGILSDSPRVMLKLRVESRDGGPTLLGRTHRLRGAVLDTYDTRIGTWKRSDRVSDTDRSSAVGEGIHHPPNNARGPLQVLNIEFADRPGEYLFSTWRPLWVVWNNGPGRRLPVEFNPYDGRLRTSARVPGLRYTVVCSPDEDSPADLPPYRVFTANIPYAPETRWIERPPAEPQFTEGPIRELAQRLLDEAGIRLDEDSRDGRGRAMSAFARHLTKTCTYTTQLTAPPEGVDPIETFLFDEALGRKGHCEYFASALAALALSVEIPARVITGYVASEFDPQTETYTVRDSHAHAWVEAEVRPGRWEEFDPSPTTESARLQASQGIVIGFFRRFFDAVQLAWVEGIVTYNRERQTSTLQAVTSAPLAWLRTLNQWVSGLLTNEKQLAEQNQPMLYTRMVSWILLLAVSAVLISRLVLTRGARFLAALMGVATRAQPQESSPAHAQLDLLHQRLHERLARAGFGRSPATPSLAHAQSLARDVPHIGEPALKLVQCYYRARFAGETPDRSLLDLAQQHLRACLHALDTAAPRPRTRAPAR